MAPHTEPPLALASGQLECQSGATPAPHSWVAQSQPLSTSPSLAGSAPPSGPWKPKQLEPHQVFFQAEPGALRRQGRMQGKGCSLIHLFIHFFLEQIIFIECPLYGRHCARGGGLGGGPSPSPSLHPSYFPDANVCEQNPLHQWAGLGAGRGRGGRGVGKLRVLPLRPIYPRPLLLQGSWGKLEEGSLRAPPTRCCWSPGPRTSPSSRPNPVRRARSGRSGRRAHSR